jgi:CheY-like chemotaxis protein
MRMGEGTETGKRVMIVDDEEAIAFIVRRVLEPEGIDVVAADSGERCLELLESEKVDLILLDIMMPGMDGWETLEEIRKTEGGRDIPVSMFTVKAGTSEKMFGSRVEGVVDYITKPFDKDDFVRRVKRALQKGD